MTAWKRSRSPSAHHEAHVGPDRLGVLHEARVDVTGWTRRKPQPPPQGLFILQERASLLSSQHYKAYVSGEVVRARIELSTEEFRALKKEAEALWGTTDWAGDFVPGLLNRELPVIEQHDGI